MTHSDLLLALLLTPLITALLSFALRWSQSSAGVAAPLVHLLGTAALLGLSLFAVAEVMHTGPLLSPGNWIYIDNLGAIFLGLIGVIGFVTGLYSIGYMNHELKHGEISAATLCNYYGFFNLFLFTMMLVVTANNIIMMWVAVEATTLGSAFLVGIYGQRSSLEAAWKYIIICTVGVAFGLYGTVLVYSNAAAALPSHEGAVFWTVLVQNAQILDPSLLRIAFVFVLIGFGTKAGLFPMHAWLPDAHSEAPSPTSALLSAVLLNCALMVIIRFYIITTKAIGPSFPQTLLLVFGLMSIAVAAFFIVVQRDMKRLLAYSSVENMGLIAVALGIGGPIGVLAALLHTINHSLAKALLFCGSGNVLLKYGTRDLDTAKGLLRVAPLSAVLIGCGVLALGGMPPFNLFVSEFMIVTGGISAGHPWIVALCLVLLTVVLGGLVRMLAGLVLGAAPDNVAKGELGTLTVLPLALLLVMMLTMGIHMPESVQQLVQRATSVVLDTHGTTMNATLNTPWQAAAQTQPTLASQPVDAAASSPAAGI